MKTAAEIQEAHDILLEIIHGRVPNPFPPGIKPFIIENAGVLCWVLDCHDDDSAFADNLAKIKLFLAQRGYQLRKAPAPFTEDTHPLGKQ